MMRMLTGLKLPHMLFYGPPGTGKTSTILALAKELYGPEFMKSRVLELNASDERGISIVREKVKDFARMQLTNPAPGYKEKYPCPPFKIIILDEADSMTQDAQSALRRTMETYSKITRFCLICNYVTRIIDPLASRCSKFRFKSLDQGNVERRLEEIAENEGVQLEDGAVQALIRCSEGDLRKAITFLQSAARLVGASAGGEKNGDTMDVDSRPVTVKIVEDIAGIIPEKTIDKLVTAMRPRPGADTYQAVAKVVEDMVADGWSAGQVVSQVGAQSSASCSQLTTSSSCITPSYSTRQSRISRRTKSFWFSQRLTNGWSTVQMSISPSSIWRCGYPESWDSGRRPKGSKSTWRGDR